ncbi:hypothetical protein [Vibrio phage phiKT1019]|nr:hypothetical protein [Vibrio phage phiKT1019]
MTIVVFHKGSMLCDSLSRFSENNSAPHRGRNASAGVVKILPAPQGTPKFVTADGELKEPDYVGGAGSTQGLRAKRLFIAELLNAFGLENFVPGNYDLETGNIPINESRLTLQLFRVGEQCFVVEYDGKALFISELKDEEIIGSGEKDFLFLLKAIFGDKNHTLKEKYATLNFMLMAGKSPDIGGDIGVLLRETDNVEYEAPNLSEEQRELLLTSYKANLQRLKLGEVAVQETEEPEPVESTETTKE